MIGRNLDINQMAPYVPNRFGGDLPPPKDLVIPCLMKLEDLIRAHPDLEIDHGQLFGTNFQKRRTFTPNGHSDGNSALNGWPGGSRNSTTIHNKTGTSQPGKSKISPPKMKIKIKYRPKKANGSQTANNTVQTEQCKEVITKDDALYSSAKPGTAGSKQALNATKGKTRSNKNLLAQNVLIQTNNMVDETIVYSLQEICQRANLGKVPSDAREICHNFRIMLYDLDLKSSRNDEDPVSHAE